MGIHGSDTENILIDNLKVQSKTKDLFMSATADATHFNYCRGRIDILNSTFEKWATTPQTCIRCTGCFPKN